jgi:hypothetical protein
MDFDNEVMRALGRIEGKLEGVQKQLTETHTVAMGLSERVSRIERWQAWLKGAWAIGAAGFLAILKGVYGK